jgi:hypothetical protein
MAAPRRRPRPGRQRSQRHSCPTRSHRVERNGGQATHSSLRARDGRDHSQRGHPVSQKPVLGAAGSKHRNCPGVRSSLFLVPKTHLSARHRRPSRTQRPAFTAQATMITPFARPAAMVTASARPAAMIAGVMSRYMARPACWRLIRRQGSRWRYCPRGTQGQYILALRHRGPRLVASWHTGPVPFQP